jgi:large subunit ribosomal protein L25
MTHAKLNVNIRTLTGNVARKLRRDGLIPAVIYGNTLSENINIEIPYNQFIKLYSDVGRTSVVEILAGEAKTSIPTLVQAVDLNPVTDRVSHIDFLAVNLKQKTIARVPLEFINESPTVKSAGAVVSFTINEVEVEAFPDRLPDKIQVNLEALDNLEAVIHISDLSVSSDYTIINEPLQVVASLTVEKEEVEEEITPEVVEGGGPAVDTKTEE